MKPTDFDLVKEIQFDLAAGITSFKDNRLVIFNANAIGQLRQNLIDKLGRRHARNFFLTFGYQSGFADYQQLKANYEFDSEIDLLSTGPIMHTAQGIVHAEAKDLSFDRKDGRFSHTGIWLNSFEAEQHLRFNPASDVPVCWSLMGYATGWATAFFGQPLLAIETSCTGMGHADCQWKIQPPETWGYSGLPYLEAYAPFWKTVEAEK